MKNSKENVDMRHGIKDVNWFCNFMGLKLYWYQKLFLSMNPEIVEIASHIRNTYESTNKNN